MTLSDSKYLRRIVLGAMAASVLLILGCGGPSSDDGPSKRTLAVIPKGTAHEFWQTVQAGAMTAAKKLDVEAVWQGPRSETMRDRQIQIVENFIIKQVDGICLAPLDAQALLPSIKRIHKSNIPVVLFDSGADTDDYVSFVATDNYAGGQLAAQTMAKLLDGKGKVIIIANEPGSGSTMKRENGFKETMEREFPAIEVVDMQYGKSDREVALTVTQNLLTRHPDVNGVFASCEPMTFGAWRALKSQGLVGKKAFIGFDSSDDLLKALRAGEIQALVVQDPFRMGYLAVETMVNHLDGKPVEKRVDTGVRVVTTENIDTPEMTQLLTPDLSVLNE